MTTPFAARDSRLSRAVEKRFGETFTIVAQTSTRVNGRKTYDADTGAQDVVGNFVEPQKRFYPKAAGIANNRVAEGAAGGPVLDVAADQLKWRPKRDDRVTRQHDGSVYLVAYVAEDGFERIMIYLTAQQARQP